MGPGTSASRHVIERSHWNLRWNCTQNRTMDYAWLGMGSERHLTTELIETRLTEDILLDGTGEAGPAASGKAMETSPCDETRCNLS